MAEITNFKCTDCSNFLEYSHIAPPCVMMDGRFICKECVERLGYIHTDGNIESQFQVKNMDDNSLTQLKNEVLESSCHSGMQAYYMNRENYYLYCKQCKPQADVAFFNFEREGPRTFLLKVLASLLEKSYPIEFISRWRNSLKISVSVSDLHKSLREQLFLESANPICDEHFFDAPYYNTDSLKFQCASCATDGYTVVFSDYRDQLINYLKAFLAECKTASIPSTVVKAIRNNSFDKNFFYVMKYVKSEKGSSLVGSSLCIVCMLPFSLGSHYPIQLHQNELHEICYTCYKTYNFQKCYIDNQDIVGDITPASCQALFKITSKTCPGRNHSKRFSYYENVIPYHVCCGVNICEECREMSNVTSGGFTCPNCTNRIPLNQIKKNEALLNQLKHTEILCENPDHAGQYAKNFNHDDIMVYCAKCVVPGKYRAQVMPDRLNTSLVNKIVELAPASKHDIVRMLLPEIFIYPLMAKLKIYRHLQDYSYEPVLRFSGFLPRNGRSMLKWIADRNRPEIISVSCEGIMEMSGVLVGRAFQDGSEVRVNCDQRELCRGLIRTDSQDMEMIMLNQTILISSRPQYLEFYFSEGKYMHGNPRTIIGPLTFHDIPIRIDSASFDNGNNLIGGPILGFVFQTLCLKDRELEIVRK